MFTIGFAGRLVPEKGVRDLVARYVDAWHVMNIAVDPTYQRQGIATMLLEELFDRTSPDGRRGYTLEVRVSNLGAQRLYEKYGFRRAGVRRRYYSDNNEDALIMWTDRLKDRSVRELLANPKVDAVVIATPVSSHFELALQALRAGKHVLVEKPLAWTSDEAQALIDVAAARRLDAADDVIANAAFDDFCRRHDLHGVHLGNVGLIRKQ